GSPRYLLRSMYARRSASAMRWIAAGVWKPAAGRLYAEDVQRLADDQPARGRRGHRVDVVVAEAEADRRAPDRHVLAQVAEADQAAGLAQPIDEALGRLPFVQVARAVRGDALQRR